MTCSLADCDRPVHARGYCGPHYYTYPKGNRKCRTCAAAQRRAYEDRQKGAA